MLKCSRDAVPFPGRARSRSGNVLMATGLCAQCADGRREAGSVIDNLHYPLRNIARMLGFEAGMLTFDSQ